MILRLLIHTNFFANVFVFDFLTLKLVYENATKKTRWEKKKLI
jgi:hypothetical protein